MQKVIQIYHLLQEEGFTLKLLFTLLSGTVVLLFLFFPFLDQAASYETEWLPLVERWPSPTSLVFILGLVVLLYTALIIWMKISIWFCKKLRWYSPPEHPEIDCDCTCHE